MNKAWWRLTLRLPAERAEAVETMLTARGALAITLLEEGAEAVFEAGRIWNLSRCEALFAGSEDPTALRAWLAETGLDGLNPELEPLGDQDWVAITQSAFPARQFGRLWVAPGWAEVPAGALTLRLDPGQAFGTGAHPTTALCLGFLSEQVRGGERVLDYGCGSGILAIGALALGATLAVGVDVDPLALTVARDNARRNGIGDDRLLLRLPADFDPDAEGPADLLVANILFRPLLDLAPLLAHAVRPGGRIALSGILHEQEEEITASYGRWFRMEGPQRQEDWSLISGVRMH